MYFSIFCYLLVLNLINAANPPDDKLTEPLCDYLKSEADTQKFKDFAIEEAKLFNEFMDKLRKIDESLCKCDETFKISGVCIDLTNCDETWAIRDEIYATRVQDDIRCVCKSGSSEKNPDIQQINNLDDYIKCWKKLWTTMNQVIDEKLLEIQNKI